MVVDFIGVKTGDVNDSAIPNGLMNSDTRNTNGELIFNYSEQTLNSGEERWVPVYATGFNDIVGFQFTLNFDPEKMEVLDMRNASLGISSSNFNFENSDQGYLTSSWNNNHGVTIDSDNPMFELLVRAKSSTDVQISFSAGSEMTTAEAYNGKFELLTVSWSERSRLQEINVLEFTLHQNEPNPWSDQTIIQIDLEKDANLTLKVTDVQGRVIYQASKFNQKGQNYWTLDKKDVPVNGILYVEISDGEHSAIKRMIKLD
jgi:hypothetical protein